MIYIGIDPGAKTGLAVWDSRKRSFCTLSTFTFWKCVAHLEKYLEAYMDTHFETGTKRPMQVIIEDPNLNKVTFRRQEGETGINDRKGQNVGMNKRDAQLWIAYFEERWPQIQVIQRKPDKHTSKKDAKAFQMLTKYQGETSQHARDAALLIFGL